MRKLLIANRSARRLKATSPAWPCREAGSVPRRSALACCRRWTRFAARTSRSFSTPSTTSRQCRAAAISARLLSPACLQSNGSFPFDSKLDEQETPEIQHLRDFSNFLAPNGMRRLSRQRRARSARPAGQRSHRAARPADPRRCHHRFESAGRRSSHARTSSVSSFARLAVAAAGHSRAGGVHDDREPGDRLRRC